MHPKNGDPAVRMARNPIPATVTAAEKILQNLPGCRSTIRRNHVKAPVAQPK